VKFPMDAYKLRALTSWIVPPREAGNGVIHEVLTLAQHLAALEALPRIVCLCGSMRFAEQFHDERERLTLEGCIVVGPEVTMSGELHNGSRVKMVLDALHMRKIDLADEVRILNVGGYIGNSTRNERDYALSRGKPVTYYDTNGEVS
jgi:hypothetical protein